MHRPRPAEQGFVLITALWLLLLCGAIVALMMLRNSGRSAATRGQAQNFQAELNRRAAVETVLADLLFRGPASTWSSPPTSGKMFVNGEVVAVELTSEDGRLDLNSGDPAFIDHSLQTLGANPGERSKLLQQLLAMRALGQSFGSMEEATPWIGRLALTEKCSDRWFTVYSGLTQPAENQLPPGLSDRLGIPASPMTRQQPRQGSALRIEAANAEGATLQVISRIVGTSRTPDILHWRERQRC